MKTMVFTENPSGLYTLLKAFITRKSPYSNRSEYHVVHASRKGMHIDPAHLKAFHDICGISQSRTLNILYPFALTYPYIMRVLCSREVPQSLFKVLNTRNVIVTHRDMSIDECFDIDCYNSAPRIVPKGIEVDMHSLILSGGNTIWEIISTYFLPGQFAPADASYRPPRLDPIDDAEVCVLKEWYLPARDRFRFARISGDTNGIHYWKYYARMMGFKRDFAQPIRVMVQCVSFLPPVDGKASTRLEFHLKGPVYYERTLRLMNIRTANRNSFDLYCNGNDRPVISGVLHTV